MSRLTFALVFSSALFLEIPSISVAAVAPSSTAPLILPDDVGSILVLVDRLPGNEDFVKARAWQVAVALRYFTTQTSWEYVDSAPPEKVESAFAVVYLGFNGIDPLSPESLARLRLAHRLVVSRYHLAGLRDAGIAFRNTEGGR